MMIPFNFSIRASNAIRPRHLFKPRMLDQASSVRRFNPGDRGVWDLKPHIPSDHLYNAFKISRLDALEMC